MSPWDGENPEEFPLRFFCKATRKVNKMSYNLNYIQPMCSASQMQAENGLWSVDWSGCLCRAGRASERTMMLKRAWHARLGRRTGAGKLA